MRPPITLTVEAKVLGQRRPHPAPWPMTLSPHPHVDHRVPLKDLLAAIVTHEVDAFHERQEQHRLTHVLLPEDVERGAARGKIDLGGHEEQQRTDPVSAVEAVLQAFNDHLYLVFVDGTQVLTLDQVVPIHDGSHLQFVRLVALVGG